MSKAISLESFSPLEGSQIQSISIESEDSLLYISHREREGKSGGETTSVVPSVRPLPDESRTIEPKAPSEAPLLSSVDEQLLESSKKAKTAATRYLMLLDSLDARHRQVSAVTSVLHAEFKRLVEAEARSRSVVERIYRPLAFFESLFVIGRRLGLVFDQQELVDVASVMREVSRITSRIPQQSQSAGFVTPALLSSHKIRPIDLPLTTYDDEFPLALERLDECIAYLSGHAQFKEATSMMLRLKSTQEHALLLVRASVQESVERVAEEAEKELTVTATHSAALIAAGKSAPPPDAVEMTQLHMRFRTDLSHIRRLVNMVEQRSQKRACAEILDECYKTYLERRIRLVSKVARSKLQRVAEERTQSLHVSRRQSAARDKSSSQGSSSPTKNSYIPAMPASVTKGPRNTTLDKTPSSSLSVQGSQRDGGGSVYSVNTSRSALTQMTSLWSDDVTQRESCVVDATRTCTALMARMLQAEYALFHSLFTAPLPGANLFTQQSSSSAIKSTLVFATTPTSSNRRRTGQSSSSSVVSGRSRSSNATTTPSTPLYTNPQLSHVRASADAALTVMQDELCTILLDVLRPLLIKVDSLDVLGDVVRVLRDEVLGELAAPRGPALVSLHKSVLTLIADTQERIVYRAGRFISERIETFKRSKSVVEKALFLNMPTSMGSDAVIHSVKINGDLDFLGRMLSFALRVQQSAQVSDAGEAEDNNAQRNFIDSLPLPAIYESWHPALEMTLVLLSSLYRCVERVSFEDLAQEAVAACTRVLISESVEINVSAISHSLSASTTPVDSFFTDHVSAELPAGSSPSSPLWTRNLASGTLRLGALAPRLFSPPAPPIDGSLFLIKNLLVLREQLSPFDISLLNTTRELDFRPTTEALQHLLGQLGSVLRFSRDNPFITFMTEGLPTVRENTTDFKLRLESLLKSACESLIHDSFVLLAGGIETYLLKQSPAPPSAATNTISQISNTALFSEEAIKVLSEVQTIFKHELPALRRRLGLYLGFQVTASILFKPIKEQVLGAIQRLRRLSTEILQTSSSSSIGDIDALCDRLVGMLESSDQLCVDPFSSLFGSERSQ
jgi:hypothetical protein